MCPSPVPDSPAPQWLVIADDLTGAADCVAPLVIDRPIPVLLGLGPLPDGTVARCVPVRDAVADVVRAAIAAAIEAPGPRRLLIKIDSAGRSPLAPVLAALADRRVLVCPALPSQGRTVVAHQVLVRGRPTATLPGHLDVPDVDSDAAMRAVVHRVLADPTLVPVVSSGFTRALGERHSPGPSGASAALVVIGTRHPVTIEQCALVDPTLTVLRSPMADTDGDPAAAVAAQVPTRLTPGTALVVTGGDTALATLRALEADGLEITGELEPGVPTARVLGGPFGGTPITLKSGGFGTPGTLMRMVAWASGTDIT